MGRSGGSDDEKRKLRHIARTRISMEHGARQTAALKLQNEQTGQSVMAFEEVTPAGTETPLHLHHDSDEVMYVLSGQYSFKIGDHVSSGRPGTCVFMPRSIPHAWKNTGDETGRAFFIYTRRGGEILRGVGTPTKPCAFGDG